MVRKQLYRLLLLLRLAVVRIENGSGGDGIVAVDVFLLKDSRQGLVIHIDSFKFYLC